MQLFYWVFSGSLNSEVDVHLPENLFVLPLCRSCSQVRHKNSRFWLADHVSKSPEVHRDFMILFGVRKKEEESQKGGGNVGVFVPISHLGQWENKVVL